MVGGTSTFYIALRKAIDVKNKCSNQPDTEGGISKNKHREFKYGKRGIDEDQIIGKM
jgi:hypothetical protein